MVEKEAYTLSILLLHLKHLHAHLHSSLQYLSAKGILKQCFPMHRKGNVDVHNINPVDPPLSADINSTQRLF